MHRATQVRENFVSVPATTERLQDVFLIAFALHYATMLFVDRAQLKSRLVGFAGNASGIPKLWSGPAASLCFSIFWLLWFVLTVVNDILGRPTASANVPWSLWQRVLLVVLVAACVLAATSGSGPASDNGPFRHFNSRVVCWWTPSKSWHGKPKSSPG